MHNCVAYTDLDKIISDIRKCAPFDFFSFYFSFSAENELYFYFSFIFRPRKKKIIFGRSTSSALYIVVSVIRCHNVIRLSMKSVLIVKPLLLLYSEVTQINPKTIRCYAYLHMYFCRPNICDVRYTIKCIW